MRVRASLHFAHVWPDRKDDWSSSERDIDRSIGLSIMVVTPPCYARVCMLGASKATSHHHTHELETRAPARAAT